MPDTPPPDAAPVPDPSPAADDAVVAAASRRMLSEDWLATIVGLVLLLLVLAGVITKGMIP